MMLRLSDRETTLLATAVRRYLRNSQRGLESIKRKHPEEDLRPEVLTGIEQRITLLRGLYRKLGRNPDEIEREEN